MACRIIVVVAAPEANATERPRLGCQVVIAAVRLPADMIEIAMPNRSDMTAAAARDIVAAVAASAASKSELVLAAAIDGRPVRERPDMIANVHVDREGELADSCVKSKTVAENKHQPVCKKQAHSRQEQEQEHELAHKACKKHSLVDLQVPVDTVPEHKHSIGHASHL